jgi:inward rectifier potassium channel
MFSRPMIVAVWDGVPSLIFRMANERTNQIVEATCNLALIRDERTREGQGFRRVHDLRLVRGRTPVFTLTWSAVHAITPDSPLHGATPESLARDDVLFVVTFTGIDETFSQTVHARYAWTYRDLAWNTMFVDVFSRLPDGRRSIDLSRLHDLRQGDAGADRPA